jgi:hypothetical protein
LVCALEDQSSGIQWYNGSHLRVGATEKGIGTEASNMPVTIKAQGETATNYAAGFTTAYVGGGNTNRFLVSKNELNLNL